MVNYDKLPSVGKSGLIRLLWEQKSAGSNPATRTKYATDVSNKIH